MDFDTHFIRDALAHLQKRDRRPQTPARLSHRYQMGPPLTESQIADVEQAYSFVTPIQYRRLLLDVGNGGAGPNWGMLAFGEWSDPRGTKPWREVFPAWSPAEPFLFTEAWNEPKSFFDQEPDFEEIPDSEQEAAEERWDALLLGYWRESLMNGAVPISEVGCGIFEWLVVTGSEAGNVWVDSRSDYRGIFPAASSGQRMSFEDWYMSWLNECLAHVPFRPTSGGWLRRIFSRHGRGLTSR